MICVQGVAAPVQGKFEKMIKLNASKQAPLNTLALGTCDHIEIGCGGTLVMFF